VDAVFLTCAHAEVECPNESVIPCTDVLKIDDNCIDILEHFSRWLAMFSVQTVNGNVQPRMLVRFPLDHVVLGLTEKSMLWTEVGSESKQFAIKSLENTRRMFEFR